MSKEEFEKHALGKLAHEYKKAIARAQSGEPEIRPKEINVVTIRADIVAQFFRDSKPSAKFCWVSHANARKRKTKRR